MNAKDTFNVGPVVDAPEMAGFTPRMWIGPITAQYIFNVGYVATDLAQMKLDLGADLGHASLNDIDPGSETGATFADMLGDGQWFDAVKKSRTGKFQYAFLEKARAETVCRLLDIIDPFVYERRNIGRRPEQSWRYEGSAAACLTMSTEGRVKFLERNKGDIKIWSSDVKALGSKSPSHHAFGLFQIVAGVHAFAKFSGWDVPDLAAIDELSGPDDEVIINETLRDRLIGGGDIALRDSVAWADRTALWSALGEENPEAFGWTPECWAKVMAKVEASDPCPDGDKHLTDSTKLGEALYYLRANWNNSIFCGVVSIPDPETRNMYNDKGDKDGPKNTARRIPLLRAFYPDEATAAAAVEELTGDAPEVKVDTSGLSIPAVYGGDADMWLGQVKQVVTESLSGVLALTPPLRAARVKAYVSSADGAKHISEMLMASSEQFTAAVETLAG